MSRPRARRAFAVAVLLVGAFGVTRAAADTSQVNRLAGQDRYETAARISQEFPAGHEVYIATGENFPDALAVGPALGVTQSPLLLVKHDSIPDVTARELTRLVPTRINVVGGPAAVSDGVFVALQKFTSGPVVRLAGSDRYGTAIAISKDLVPPAVVPYVLVVTGRDFPDALFAGAVGALIWTPMVLVDGQAPLTPEQIEEVQRLAPTRNLVILGDFNAVSLDVERQLDALVPTLRITENAYNRGAILWSLVDPDSTDVVLVTGENFPDGLAAAGYAGLNPGRLTYLVPHDCIPPAVGNEIGRLRPAHITLIGGPAALSTNVENLVRCT